ncbi:hypothetical protein RZR38_18870 [Citrobacter freundii]|uniref:hypothetical protein n=1 Tax=Citrobacter freundii TaxID=546 RepID=UPI00292B95C2|nr:hypothetical protein [Citrobacter freundii]MDV1857832.1 hypothetical protein [Citrobacter freundii]MEB0419026.1 hypothetical protein [Citrobacter freundii]MEB0916555.1 hypothetical protein [Citrobacter freundii]
MELTKGKVYNVDPDEWMAHCRAEYHSTFNRWCDGMPLHNMIIRMRDGDLEISTFATDNIISEAEEPV